MPKPTTGTGRGRKPMPPERRRLLGLPTPHAAPAPGAPGVLAVIDPAALPAAPGHLGPVGRETWRYLWSGGRRWLAEGADALLVARVAERVEEVARLRDYLGTDPEARWYASPNGQLVTHPAVRQIEQADAQITAWLSLLGFSPSDRARLGYAEVRTADALEQFRARKAERDAPAATPAPARRGRPKGDG